MSAETERGFDLQIAHVLFIDLVGYSKMLIDEQRERMTVLTRVIRNAAAFRAAEAANKLIRLPSGDGMALAFFDKLEAPVLCAMQISTALRAHPEVQVRMGVHSGPVGATVDVNDTACVGGSGINMAQRVMDCGDAGHILVSRHVAEDLGEYRQWVRYLHELGTIQVKHGVEISVFNLYSETFGNPELPRKFVALAAPDAAAGPRGRVVSRWQAVGGGVAILLLLAVLTSWLLSRKNGAQPPERQVMAPAREKSIAVLPFENLSDEKQNAYFTYGVQDEILTYLAKLADLKVISRTSVMQYKGGTARNVREIGQQLGVTYLLEGSVGRVANKVRVNAQLIDARDDAHIWGEIYDRSVDDLFAIQSEIAKTIAGQLQAKISPRENAALELPATTDLAAYELYQRAQALHADLTDQVRAREKLPEAARLLDGAVARDPRFMLAWCLLARVHGDMYFHGHDRTPARLEATNSAVQAALRLQPDAGEPHLALANYYYRGFRDYERARVELAIARRTLPNNAELFEYTGYIDRRDGRWQESTKNLERALELDPRNLLTLQQLALTYHYQRRYEDEIRIEDRALAIQPDDARTRIYRAQIALDWRADIKPLQAMLATIMAENPNITSDVDDPAYALCERTPEAAARLLAHYPPVGMVRHGVNYPRAYWEGLVARWQADAGAARQAFTSARGEAEALLENQPEFAAALSLLGLIDAGLGRKEEALREGRRACELLPVAKDSIAGAALMVNLAQIYTWTGEKDLAIDQIGAVQRVPNDLSYGQLKLHPQWDPLRGDSRFEQLVASHAPESARSGR